VNPFAVRRRVLKTALDPATCEARLKARLEHPFAAFSAEERPLSGWVARSGFAVRRVIGYRNPYQTEAVGRFVALPHGTRVDLQLGLTRWARLGTALWGIWCLAFAAVGPALALQGGTPARLADVVVPAAFAAGFIVFQGMVIALGRFLARHEEAFIVQLLKQALDAEETPAGS
jgi:hypothetical protein